VVIYIQRFCTTGRKFILSFEHNQALNESTSKKHSDHHREIGTEAESHHSTKKPNQHINNNTKAAGK
jgi:hypothetical protein